jgi:hypothetical protein
MPCAIYSLVMDLEHLTKKQTILLTFLVSFVTSIATGIVSVSLMQQMPTPVTQTINRVVERTLERVVEKKTDARGVVTTKEKTVVVRETDLISSAVQAAVPSLVSIYALVPNVPAKVAEVAPATDDPTKNAIQTALAADAVAPPPEKQADKPGEKTTRVFLGHGVFMSDSSIRTDATGIKEDGMYEIVSLASGARTEVTHVSIVGTIATLTVPKKSGVGIQVGSTQKLQLGNTLLVLGGESRVQVSSGIISDIDRDEKKDITGISLNDVHTGPGSVLVDLEGKLVALYIKGMWALQ